MDTQDKKIEVKFPFIIKRKRAEKGLSQADISRMLNVSRDAISKWEKGQKMPSGKHTLLLMDLLGITIEEIIDKKTDDSENSESLKKRIERLEKIITQNKLVAVNV